MPLEVDQIPILEESAFATVHERHAVPRLRGLTFFSTRITFSLRVAIPPALQIHLGETSKYGSRLDVNDHHFGLIQIRISLKETLDVPMGLIPISYTPGFGELGLPLALSQLQALLYLAAVGQRLSGNNSDLKAIHSLHFLALSLVYRQSAFHAVSSNV